jgi:hypothetical protein
MVVLVVGMVDTTYDAIHILLWGPSIRDISRERESEPKNVYVQPV